MRDQGGKGMNIAGSYCYCYWYWYWSPRPLYIPSVSDLRYINFGHIPLSPDTSHPSTPPSPPYFRLPQYIIFRKLTESRSVLTCNKVDSVKDKIVLIMSFLHSRARTRNWRELLNRLNQPPLLVKFILFTLKLSSLTFRHPKVSSLGSLCPLKFH